MATIALTEIGGGLDALFNIDETHVRDNTR
jgi:hypothetical protein